LLRRPMASDENNDNSSATYLDEDILINILQWLPIASCIARFRCVCRSWRTLLSDPIFIRKIIFSQTSDDKKKLKVLISDTRLQPQGILPLLCSVYSYETLRPITDQEELHVSLVAEGGCCRGRVVGCCDGIFCVAGTTRDANGNYLHGMILWNPITSEKKIIPPGPSHPCHSSHGALMICAERIGFGYDPKTKDYKIVRVLELEERMTDDDDMYDYDPAEYYHGTFPLVSAEVYSLRNDSWKTLNVPTYPAMGGWFYDPSTREPIATSEQFDTSRNEKCYWFRRVESPGACAVISFDMSTEVFELITIPHPTGLTHHDEDNIDDPYGDRSSLIHENRWEASSYFMLKKGGLLVTFSSLCFRCYASNVPDDEIWVMLKCGVAESWTKLSTWTRSDYCFSYLEVWKDNTYICAWYDMSVRDNATRRSDNICIETRRRHNICVRDIATSEVIHKEIEIEGTLGEYQAHIFTPTQVSMSQLFNILE
ncbi:Putative F-box protein At3g16210, partial [Linum perenne]